LRNSFFTRIHAQRHLPAVPAHMAAHSTSQRVLDLFFNPQDVLLTTELCVRSISDCVGDPLTVFGNLAIQTPVSCTLTSVGLLPFSSDMRVLVPFSRMTVAQLEGLRVLASSSNATHPAANRYKHQHGGLTVVCQGDSRRVFADAALILYAVNVLILRAVDGRFLDVGAVINVTQQRIIASIQVHRSQLALADDLTRKYLAARQSTAPPP